jgi:prolyl-tRNA editing enzyme YbaK/EbsC (Cys-tRNA(Pro) deacylase)
MKSRLGIEAKVLYIQTTISSVLPPKKPAAAPSDTPIKTDIIPETSPTLSAVELAAAALGCEPKRIAKSLSFSLDGGAILVVSAGDAKVDNPKYKATFGTKAKMLSPDEVTSLIGHAVGGVCPFGINEGVKVYLDESLRRFETVFPAAGSSNSAIELTPDELFEFSRADSWEDLCKAREA